MGRKSFALIAFTFFLLISILGLSIEKSEGSGTIYIRDDGSVEGTDKIQRVGDLYTFTDNINDSIVVEKDGIVVDGDGYTLQGTGSGDGIRLSNRTEVTIKNVEIRRFGRGIDLSGTTNCIIQQNYITENDGSGIYLSTSSENNIVGNEIHDNGAPSGLAIGNGVTLLKSNNNLVSNNILTNNEADGVVLEFSNSNIIHNNIIIENYFLGVIILSSENNTVNDNVVSSSIHGITISSSTKTRVENNKVSSTSDAGINLEYSSTNLIYHNNFINNTGSVVMVDYLSINIWDNGYPDGGNYWSGFNGTDTDNDGIRDTPYYIDANNTDNYPLAGMYSDFDATPEHVVQFICNSSISDYNFNGSAIDFNAMGKNGTTGFCRITIPTALINETYRVFVNRIEISYNLLPVSNSTHSYLYFTYDHSTKEITIIPEFASLIILPLFMLATLLVTLMCSPKKSKA